MKKLLLSCSMFFGMIISAQTYCTPAFDLGCDYGDQIDSFTISAAGSSPGFSHLDTGCSSGAYGDFTSQTVTLQAGFNHPFSVTHGYGTQNVRIWIDFNQDGTFNDAAPELVATASSTVVNGTYTSSGNISIPVTVTPGTYRMRVADRYSSQPIPCNIDGYGEAHDYTVSITSPPNCYSPAGLAVSNITTNSVTLSWTPLTTSPGAGYDIYYSTSNTAPTASTSPSLNSASSPATLSSLSTATTYYVWIRANCSASEQSAWTSTPLVVTTLCNSFTIPYSENFDTSTLGSATNNNAPNCWKYLEPAGWPGYGYVNTDNVSSPNGYYIYSTNTTGGGMLVSPTTTDLMSGNNRVRFMAKGGGSGYNMQVGTLSNPYDPSTFTMIGNLIPVTETFAQYIVNIPAGTNQYLAFRHPGQSIAGTSLRFDNIFIEPLPSCAEPSGFSITGITFNEATVNWTASPSSTATGYEIYRSTTSAAPTASTVPTYSTATTTQVLTGLTPSTNYYVWVRTVCGATDRSGWMALPSFQTLTLCPAVTAPANNAIGISTTGTITWNAVAGAMGYRLTVGTTAGGNDIMNNVDIGNVTSYQFTPGQLNTGTKYYYTVNGYAGSTVSINCDNSNFTTVCTTYTAPYAYNFNDYPAPCWTFGSGGDIGNGPTGTDQYWYTADFLNGPLNQAAYINLYSSGKTGWLISPAFDLASGNYRMKFDYGVTGYFDTSTSSFGSDDKVAVLISLDNGSTWNAIESWDVATPVSNTPNNFVYNIPAGSGNVKFAFYATEGTVNDPEDYQFFVDNFKVELIPTCTEPSALAASGVTATSATISWTAPTPAPALGYDVYYTTSSTPPTSTTPPNTNVMADTVNLSNLSPATTYHVWVRSRCSATDQSPWEQITINTLCATITPAYTNTFDTSPGNCWTVAAGGTPATGPVAGSTIYYNWTSVSFLGLPGNMGTALNLYYENRAGWLISPTFDLSGGAYKLTFNYGVTAYGGTAGSAMGADDVVNVLMSTDDGATWTVVKTWTAADNVSNTSNLYEYIIPVTTSNTVKFAIYGADNVDDPQDYYFHVDNFTIASALATSEIANNAKDIRVYPNPFTDILNVSDAKDLVSVTVTDMSGRTVKTIAKPTAQLHLADLSSGLYLVTLKYKDGTTKTVKAIKK